MRLARELRREARLLDASLEGPRRRPDPRGPRNEPNARPKPPAPGQAPPIARRRFTPGRERPDPVGADASREPDGMEISDGTRLMVTNMITLGSSREEILATMRDELGLENADVILARLSS
jgi:hypothetical protein